MPTISTRGDSILVRKGAIERQQLVAVGELPGVLIAQLAARNGPGTGALKTDGTGTTLAWRAPGSGRFGVPVAIPLDGSYLLEDGVDPDRWARVTVDLDFLPAEARFGRVFCVDRYDNTISMDDVTAGEASAGSVETQTLTLENQSPHRLRRIVAWIDPTVVNMEISDDGAVWVSPTTEATGLVFADLTPGADHTVHLRRTIAAGADSSPKVLNWFHVRFYRP